MWNQSIDLWAIQLSVYQVVVLAAFIALIVGYALGWWMNRRQKGGGASSQGTKAAPNTAFMRGINHILSDRPDAAIEELTRAASLDTETIETYVALGNLFRGKGEIGRAIRIRQSIILRPNIDEKTRRSAQFDLGLDYRRGGFHDRAVETFEEVVRKDPANVEAWRNLVQLFEEIKDWDKAARALEKMARLTGFRPENVLAHYQVETGKAHQEENRIGPAKTAYKRALVLDPNCVDAYLHLGDLYISQGQARKAMSAWRKIVDVAPEFCYLTFNRLGAIASDSRNAKLVEHYLNETAAGLNNPLAHLALSRLLIARGNFEGARLALHKALDSDPSLIEARRELGRLLLGTGRNEDALTAYRDLLARLEIPQTRYQCGHCGFESSDLIWRCPQCLHWDAMVRYQTPATPATVEAEPPRPIIAESEPEPLKLIESAAPDKEGGASGDKT